MNDLDIRPAESTDFSSIRQLYNQVDEMHHQALPDLFKSVDEIDRKQDYFNTIISNPGNLYLVAVNNKTVVALVYAEIRSTQHPFVRDYEYGHIVEIVVDSNLMREGIGERLMDDTHDWLLKHGVDEVNLTVFSFNQGAMAFYKKLQYHDKHVSMTRKLKY